MLTVRLFSYSNVMSLDVMSPQYGSIDVQNLSTASNFLEGRAQNCIQQTEEKVICCAEACNEL